MRNVAVFIYALFGEISILEVPVGGIFFHFLQVCLTDHLDLRLVAPSPLALSPTPLAPGVVAWACVALAATTTTPAENWEVLVDRVVAKWANHTLLPRPHWGKEVPAMVGEEEAVAYLRRAYARELPGVVAAMGALVGGQGGGLQDTANTFGTPFNRQLFLI